MITGRKKFNIQNKVEKIVDYVYTCTEKSPKKLRCDIIPEMRKFALSALENTMKANRIFLSKDLSENEKKARKDYQFEADISAQMIEALADICLKRGYLTQKQFDFLTTLTFEFREMIDSWMASDVKRLS